MDSVMRRFGWFVLGVIAAGVLAGLAGGATAVVLKAIQHVTFGYWSGTLLDGISAATAWRRVAGPVVGGALAGAGWWWLRRRRQLIPLTVAIERGEPVATAPRAADSSLQILLVGTGASLGREGAAREFAAVAADLVLRRIPLPESDIRVLLASAAGAGLGAVYNVPLAGALFTIQLLLHSWRPREVLTATLTSVLAVVAAWPVVGDRPTFVWPGADLTAAVAVVAPAAVAASMALGAAFSRLMSHVQQQPVSGWWLIPALAGAGALTGISALWFPELPGNGKSIITESLGGGGPLLTVAAIALLKPVLTATHLRAGAVGGLITPALATGAAFGAAVAILAEHWTGWDINPAAVSLLAAAAFLGFSQRAPLFAVVFAWELAHPPPTFLLALALIAVVGYGVQTGVPILRGNGIRGRFAIRSRGHRNR
ncbi:putative ClC chloride channel [Gordonia polyisoprenivorans NBRC 16320 = JCM 10675]|uniref:Chloride channel protein n=2 Tax=Gordonia polyisoprenivorans TaxID=84595 RepID=A0A846WI14_9ACTN|nr:chloride channel protein [uncultured Gordonia sp.]NKY01375.1 chloride channel protein [Gordonia polyisoprenivorans]OZC29656.1 chloride channel protein [Gordonia polyisoprenivorans]GAB25610.1 putative ClC chloride channel [Gordonia polyisoprenivorans NBRC 16320 = JCM 10675]